MSLAGAALLCAAYVAYFAGLTSFPLQDFPNHLARAEVISDLLFDGGARFGSGFGVALAPIPYVLHDLIFATLIQVLGTTAGAAVFLSLVVLSLPGALLLYMHLARAAPRDRLAIVVLGLFLSTDTFLFLAFLGFRLAIALVVVSLACAEWLRERFTIARYATYIAVLAAGYFIHLTAPVFFFVTIGVSAAVRLVTSTSTLRREALLVAPVAIILVVYFGLIRPAYLPDQPAQFVYSWGRLPEKLLFSPFELERFGGRSSHVLIVLLAACVLTGVWRALRPASLKSIRVVESLLIALVFVGLYILMPRRYSDAAYVDVRALSMVVLFLFIASLWLSHSLGGQGYGAWPVRLFALALAALNLGWIAMNLTPFDRWMSRYRALAAAVPVGARVLPVSTTARAATFGPLLHVGAWLIIDRQAMEPYLFSRDRGDPMQFFFYLDRPYLPEEGWYREQLKWRAAVPATYHLLGQDYTWRFEYSRRNRVWEPLPLVPVEWARIACDYRWLLVTKPYEPQLIAVNTRLVTQNETAALLKIEARSCPPPPRHRIVRLPSEH